MSSSEQAQMETVVIAISKQSHSEYALDWFLKHLMKEQFHLILTHVAPSPMDSEYFTTIGTFSVPTVVYTGEQLESLKQKIVEEGRHYLNETAAHIRKSFPNAKIDCIIEVGNARDGLVDVIERVNADMLIIGSRQMSGFKRAFLGSTSDYCVNHASCPVVVVKEQNHKKK